MFTSTAKNFNSFVAAIIIIATETSQAQDVQGACDGALFGTYARNPYDSTCKSYFWCLWTPVPQSCAGILIFDLASKRCTWPFLTECSPPVTEEEEETKSEPEVVDPCRSGNGVYHPYGPDCRQYIACGGGNIPYRMRCPLGLVWRQSRLYCDYVNDDGCRASQYEDEDTGGDGNDNSGDNGNGDGNDGGNGDGNTDGNDGGNGGGNTDGNDGGNGGGNTDGNDGGNGGGNTDGNNGESGGGDGNGGNGGSDDGNGNGNSGDDTRDGNDGEDDGGNGNSDDGDGGNDGGDGNSGGNGPASNTTNAGDCGRIVCYFTNWAQYRAGIGKFLPENIEANHCTHIMYAFATISNGQLKAYEWNDESTQWMTGLYARVMKLKESNPSLKVLLAVGGWNLASAPFTAIVASESTRERFISTSIEYLRKWNFDGLDLDWEYPANRGSPGVDKFRFSLLLQEAKAAYTAEAVSTGRERLLLTAAVAAGIPIINSAYEIPELAQNLDFVNLMSYDLHGAWDPVTGHNSPFRAASWERGSARYLNYVATAQYWVRGGLPKEKLVLGVPFYGRSFTLSGRNTGVGAPVTGAGTQGPFTRAAGFMAYYEVCSLIANGGTVTRIPEMEVPYVVQGNQWVGYDDPESLDVKVNYIVNNGFGGVMIWSIGMDDHTGQGCKAGRYPLMRALRAACNA